jgi:outer membrane receptor protein involved in Fe transport
MVASVMSGSSSVFRRGCASAIGDRGRRPARLIAQVAVRVASGALAWVALPSLAEPGALGEVEVVSTMPLAGIETPVDQVPSNVQSISPEMVRSQPVSNLGDLLNGALGSVSVSNASGNPYQNDVSYRGYQASSLLGAPVGLSVYFDGVRMNEPFGSIVNWDLIPVNAISSINVVPGSNPLFGLNTLGGAVVVNTKNGADNPGQTYNLLGGSFGRRAFNAERGWVDAEHNTDHFIAVNLDRQDGFRDHSGSDVRQFYAKSRWHSDDRRTQVELSTALADTMLAGTQALPLSMMGNPKSSYTWPDSVANRMILVNAKASHWTDDDHSFTGNVYYRNAFSGSVNSNAQLDDGCFDENANVLAACRSLTAGTGTAPNATPANPYGLASYSGQINTSMVYSQTHQNTVGANAHWSSYERLAGHDNALTLGFSADSTHIDYAQSTLLARLVDYQAVVTPNLGYYFPSSAGTTGSNVLNTVALASTTRDLSLFASDRFHLSERLSVTASGSYNVALINQTGQSAQSLNGDGGYSWTDPGSGQTYYNPAFMGAQYYQGNTLTTINPATVASWTAGPESSSLDGQHSYRRFNPSLGLNWKASEALGLFGHYSESMRAPTSIELSCADPTRPCLTPTGFNGDPALKAVVARTVEIGARAKPAPGWSVSTAAYLTRASDDIQFINANSVSGYFANVGTTERKGLDLSVDFRNAESLLRASVGYVIATYQSAFTTAQGVNVVPGDRIPGIADLTFKLLARHQFTDRFAAGAGLVAASGQYAHGDEGNSDPSGKVPGYAVANLDLSYRFDDRLSFVAVVNNVFDRRYSTFGVLGTNVYTGVAEPFRTPAAPRAIWVGVRYSLGGKSSAAPTGSGDPD